MPFVPVSGVFQWILLFNLFNQAVSVTHDFLTGVTMDETYLNDISLALRNAWLAHVSPIQSSQISRVQSRAISQASSSAPEGQFTETSVNSGGVSEGTGAPGSVTIAVKKATLNRGRSYRGRMYVPGIPLSALSSGNADTVTSTFISNLLSALGLFYADALTADSTLMPVVVSRFSGVDPITHKPVPRTSGIKTPVAALVVNNQVDSQRRRLAGRGT